MAKSIPENFIADLVARTNIVDVIGARVKLKRAGSGLVGLCPFHSEKTPSFNVNPNKQFFHCFGCGAHGNVIGFIMQYEHLDFLDAIDNLATKLGITVPRSAQSGPHVDYSELYKLNSKSAQFFEKQLPRALHAVDYLKSRGLTGEICKKFGIGYANNNWENLRSLYNSTPKTRQQLIATGLLISKENKVFSRFRERIMFPIKNTRGNVIGFGGRTLANDPAKYLNSPETVLFHKSEELYGLYEAKQANNNLKYIIVVEGYLDVIALSQFGITATVATLGTSISAKQVQLLLRNTSEIIFCFDGDLAGRTAAWRALENSLPLMRDGMQVKFLFLPEKDDPDSLIRKEGKDAFIKRVETAISLSDFFLNHITSIANPNTMAGRAKIAQTGKEIISKMPNSIFKQLLLDKMAQLININVQELMQIETNKFAPTEIPYNNKSTPQTSILRDMPVVLQNAVSILLHYPELAGCIENIAEIKNINLPGINVLTDTISLIKTHPKISMGAIIELWRDHQAIEVVNVLACREPIIPAENLKNELVGIIQALRQEECEQTIKKLMLKAATEGLLQNEKHQLSILIGESKKQKLE